MIEKKLIESVLAKALSSGGDFAEIYCEDSTSNGIALIDGKIDKINGGRSYGVGIRIYKGLNSVYGYSNDASPAALEQTALKAAAAIGDVAADSALNIVVTHQAIENAYPIERYPADVDIAEKINLLKGMNAVMRESGSLVSQTIASYSAGDKRVLIANSEGLLKEDRRTRTRLVAQVIASKNGENQTGYFAPGRHMGFEVFKTEIDPEAVAREAARIALTMIEADPAPAGQMPVVLDNAFGGVIFHEACGHSLEATSVAKNASEFAGKLGEQIASPLVTAIDDGTIPHAWGSQNIDDEGHLTRKNVLIENGILKGYMIDRLNGRRMGMAPTGNARRESYKFEPTSRMTNTYIAPGEHSREEIFGSIERGFYAKKLGGGSVNPGTGDFNFSVLEGYLIENGQIGKPLRGASLIGKGADILKKIDRVGSNLDYGTGMCGSLSGSIPVYVGQPMIRVSNMVVGGK
ncbi:MAG: peptidase C69 [Clostridiales bacterium]|nr:MAG: peptidase C69 [Clostridiales bacterium]